jgi:hypothetical protein
MKYSSSVWLVIASLKRLRPQVWNSAAAQTYGKNEIKNEDSHIETNKSWTRGDILFRCHPNVVELEDSGAMVARLEVGRAEAVMRGFKEWALRSRNSSGNFIS